MPTCPGCQTTVAVPRAGHVARCVECGRVVEVVTPPPIEGTGTDWSSHHTPYGRVASQVQADGTVVVAHILPKLPEPDRLTRLVSNLAAELKKLDHPHLARFHAFEPGRR